MITQKLIDPVEFERWNNRYRAAKADLSNREEAIKSCIETLEQDMDLLGITGVEGKNLLSLVTLSKLGRQVTG